MKKPDSPHVHVVLIALLGLLAYSNTFEVPFQFDDFSYIKDNPIIRDGEYFLGPSSAGDLDLPGNVRTSLYTRYTGYLSFFMNHKLHGLNVAGYHVVNLLVHLVNALLVYLFVLLVFKTPRMRDSTLENRARRIAFLTALLFALHPVQTQAVTYISQRFASLAAMFYLLSLVCYAAFRLSDGKAKRTAFYVLCLVAVMLAMTTKETAFTLPVAIALFELMFFKGGARRFVPLVPVLLTMAYVPLSLMEMDKPLAVALGEASRTGALSRWAYLFTEFRVLVTYLRLLAFPVNQNLDYDYPVHGSFFEMHVVLSFLFLAAVFCFGVLPLGARAARTPRFE